MSYIYVKSGGTATGTAGKYETAKTGSWNTAFSGTSEYYGSLQSCISNASLGYGDIIYISDTHNYQYTVSSSTDIYSVVKDIYCYSVDDDDIAIPSPGATEYIYCASTTAYTVTYGVGYIYGMTIRIKTSLHLTLNGLTTSTDYPTLLCYEHCNFVLEEYSSPRSFTLATSAIFINCSFNLSYPGYNYSNRTISSFFGSLFFRNCIFQGLAGLAGSYANIFTPTYNPVYLECCDFSQIERQIVGNTTYPNSGCVASRCLEYPTHKFQASSASIRERSGQYLDDSVTSSIRYVLNGKIETDESVYRIGGASWDRTTYYSYKVTTTSYVSRFKLCEFFKTPVKNQKLEVYLAHNLVNPLTNQNVRLEFSYVNSSTNSGKYLTSLDLINNVFQNYEIIPASSRSWNGLTGTTFRQQLSLIIPSEGVYGLCTVWLILPANSVIYVCPKVEFV